MGIKSFFQKLGRGIKKGFDSFVSSAGNVLGSAGTFLQRKAIPAIASGANQVAGLIGKATPLLEMAGPEASATAGEVADVASKVGAGVGQFAKFIGSDLPTQGTPMNAQQIADFNKSPFGMAIKRSQTKAPVPVPAPAPAPTPAVMPANPNPLKIVGAVKAPIGSNPASYSPIKSSGIEAPPSASQPIIKAVGGGSGAPMLSM